jgi:hypothetical protein
MMGDKLFIIFFMAVEHSGSIGAGALRGSVASASPAVPASPKTSFHTLPGMVPIKHEQIPSFYQQLPHHPLSPQYQQPPAHGGVIDQVIASPEYNIERGAFVVMCLSLLLYLVCCCICCVCVLYRGGVGWVGRLVWWC